MKPASQALFSTSGAKQDARTSGRRRSNPGGNEPGRADVLVAKSAAQHVQLQNAAIVGDRELPKLLRERASSKAGPPSIVACARFPTTLVRTLRQSLPDLVIATGDEVPELDCKLLGPHATCCSTATARDVVCATDREELEALRSALGRPTRLAISPTPSWLAQWLTDELDGHRCVGYVSRAALDLSWARWHDQAGHGHVLVPLGLPAVELDAPPGRTPPDLATCVAGQSLERYTGPVFPAPQVLTRIFDELTGQEVASESAMELWRQAQRALPGVGGTLGMEAPLPGMSLEVPTAAYLAQRARLVRSRRVELTQSAALVGDVDESAVEDDGLQRASEVLRASGEVLTDHESKVVLRGIGIEITRQAVASSASGAAGFAARIGFPVVLKALSPDLRRRRELGAVALNLQNASAVRRAYGSIMRNVAQHAPTARLDGVVVAEMVGAGLEIRCGGIRLHDGSVAIFGLPLRANAVAEPCLALGPLENDDALLLADSVLSAMPFPALRRESDPDVQLLATIFERVDALFRHTEDRLLRVELSPIRLLGTERGYVTLDAQIIQRPHLEGR